MSKLMIYPAALCGEEIKGSFGPNVKCHELSIKMNDCAVMEEEFHPLNETTLWSIGNIVDGKFERNMYLGETYHFQHDLNILEANSECMWC